MSVQAEIAAANAILLKDGIVDPARDSRAIMAHVLGVENARLTLHSRDEMSEAKRGRFRALIQRRLGREPVSHIIGGRQFYGRWFAISSDVLDPRGDTETLIEAALAVPFESVLDLGTGSGCIVATLLAERPKATGIATDTSEQALAVAKRNAAELGVEDRCAFEASDWFSGVGGSFDLIVSNPPYIALDEMAGLAPELSHEPRMALTDEGDGLSCYRIITVGAPAHLNAGGWLIVEIGPTQGAAVRAMFEAAGLAEVRIRPDLDGRDRVIMGQKPL